MIDWQRADKTDRVPIRPDKTTLVLFAAPFLSLSLSFLSIITRTVQKIFESIRSFFFFLFFFVPLFFFLSFSLSSKERIFIGCIKGEERIDIEEPFDTRCSIYSRREVLSMTFDSCKDDFSKSLLVGTETAEIERTIARLLHPFINFVTVQSLYP